MFCLIYKLFFPSHDPDGAAIYLDNSDYTKVSTDNTSNVLIGYCINENAEDNALFIRLA